MKTARTIAIAGGALASALLLNHRLGRRWGATAEEVRARLPGDELVLDPAWETTHGITIHASAAEIWPWLVQMGITRGGWYLSEWLDRLIWGIDSPSADCIIPELQHLAPGDIVPDSVDGTAHFRVVTVDPGNALVLYSRRHPTNGVWPDLTEVNPGLHLDFSWAFVLRETGEGTTRLLLRARGVLMNGRRRAPAWTKLALPLVDFADFIYTRQMLHGVRQRLERAKAGALEHPHARTRPAKASRRLPIVAAMLTRG